jgi:hypothetical protein
LFLSPQVSSRHLPREDSALSPAEWAVAADAAAAPVADLATAFDAVAGVVKSQATAAGEAASWLAAVIKHNNMDRTQRFPTTKFKVT